MRVEQLGEGTPSVAVVGGIHGDEPCGVAAVERLIEAAPPVAEPVKLVVANERAVERGERYLDADLNRSFPGDPDADAHERRLAAALADELEGCTTLALHSTQSHPEPFLVADRIDALVERLAAALPVAAVVTTDEFIQGRLFAAVRTVEVECGLQGTDAAADAATRLSIGFLDAMGAMASADARAAMEELGVATAGDVDPDADVPVFELTESVPKTSTGEHAVLTSNFERVPAGEPFARTDRDQIVAEESFYPVLMSADGYRDIFGYAAERTRVLSSDGGRSGERKAGEPRGRAE